MAEKLNMKGRMDDNHLFAFSTPTSNTAMQHSGNTTPPPSSNATMQSYSMTCRHGQCINGHSDTRGWHEMADAS